MFKELQVTLYDVFGYLLPGAILVLGLVVLFWALFWPTTPLWIYVHPPMQLTIGVGFFAYLAGHVAQAVGNFLEQLPKVKRKLEFALPVSHELEMIVREAVAKQFGEKAKHLAPKELLAVCDQALVHAASLGDREIFVYREGFYRGICVSLAFFALTLSVRLWCSPAVIRLTSRSVELHRRELGAAGVLAILGSWLSFRRYLRFAYHKNSSCLARFVALVSFGQINKT